MKATVNTNIEPIAARMESEILYETSIKRPFSGPLNDSKVEVCCDGRQTWFLSLRTLRRSQQLMWCPGLLKISHSELDPSQYHTIVENSRLCPE